MTPAPMMTILKLVPFLQQRFRPCDVVKGVQLALSLASKSNLFHTLSTFFDFFHRARTNFSAMEDT